MNPLNPNATKVITCPWDTHEPKAEFTFAAALSAQDRFQLQDAFQELLKDYPSEKMQLALDSIAGKKAVEMGATPEGDVVNLNVPAIPQAEMYAWFENVVRVSLKSIRYSDRTEWVASNGSVPKETLKALSMQRLPVESTFDNYINWLGSEIWKANQLSETEKKTSDLPLMSASTSEK